MAANGGMYAITAAQTAGTFAAQRAQARAAGAQGEYEGKVLDENAKLAGAQAVDAVERGKVAADLKDQETTQRTGAARASMAAQGLDIATGSAVDVQGNIAKIGAIDRATIENNAAREAWGYKVQATDLTRRAQLARSAGANARAGLDEDSLSTLLSGAAKTYGIYRGSDFAQRNRTTKSAVVPGGWSTPSSAPDRPRRTDGEVG